jgi:threonine dehydrogenase-like Zn-dependent dehydrogenase
MHALVRGRLAPGEQMVVFGAGPIGLATPPCLPPAAAHAACQAASAAILTSTIARR